MNLYDCILEGMTRQEKGFALLEMLLNKEFENIKQGKIDAVTELEFSIHELLRQLAVERDQIGELLQRKKLSEYLPLLKQEMGDPLKYLADKVLEREQICAKQASRNAELVLALLDQGADLLDFLQKQLIPKNQDVYSAAGRFRNMGPQYHMLRGKL